MHSKDFISKSIFTDLVFTEEEIDIISSVFSEETFKKGESLLEAGDTVDAQYFILSGCLRSYYMDSSGKEHTLQFGIKDWWMSDYTGFFLSTKAILNIEVIQDTRLYKISKSNKEYLYAKIPQIESFFRKKLERAFASFQKRILSNLSENASERYLNFIHTYPNIEKLVKNYHIASYLGITTESLSRIRRELAAN